MTLVLLIILGVVGWVILTYNGLIGRRNRVDNAWKQIDVQLRRRHDLIPNLVETVKGAMEFERETLENVMSARAKAVGAHGVAESVAAENQLSGSLGRLFAVMENYPQLKSNENILQLQEELSTTENQLTFARQHYNDAATDYNTSQQTFPANMIAGFFAFQPSELFSAGEAEKVVPKVDIRLGSS